LGAADRRGEPRRIVLVGTTASGKSDVALALAEPLDAEIVGADSRQVYRSLEIGTAAPSAQDRARVPHHFIAFLDPSETYSAGRFAREARAVLADIEARGRTALIVGGSGLYLRALLSGLFEGPERDPALRGKLNARLRLEGLEALRSDLGRVDPEALEGILPGDAVRVIRALEVHALTGRPISSLRRERAGASIAATWFGLRWSRPLLAARIEERVRAQIAAGFLEEARRLLALRLPPDAPGPRTLGYAEILEHLGGMVSLEEATRRIAQRTRQLAKRQETWFRRLEGIAWLDLGGPEDLSRAPARILARLAPEGNA
jgi:tRNA dimethylallyltransferase